jgi:DNA-binding HxlR family transcriptional regulator
VPTITQKMLTQQLRELEVDNIVVRTVFDQVPPKVVYSVVESERDRLGDVLQVLCDWGLYWCAKTGARIVAFDEPAASRG